MISNLSLMVEYKSPESRHPQSHDAIQSEHQHKVLRIELTRSMPASVPRHC